MKNKILKTTIVAFIIILTLFTISLTLWVTYLNITVNEKIANGWFSPPVEIYTRAETISIGQTLPTDSIIEKLNKRNFRKRKAQQVLYNNDYSFLSSEECTDKLSLTFSEEYNQCIIIQQNDLANVIALDEEHKVQQIYKQVDGTFTEANSTSLPELLFAQFSDGKPILRNIIKISDSPLQCLQATTAIEDSQFLFHRGISPLGIIRSALKNLIKGRYAQGGSTITQQLVKNYFLTPEKTIKRKVTELIIALLIELKLDKDEILENYLNIIYMGQNGPFQVRGFSAAANHYFAKPLAQLKTEECALLAAIINSPGRYNPFKNPEKALKRRNHVLQKMLEQGHIDEQYYNQITKTSLPEKESPLLSEPAPYFTQAILRKIKELNIKNDDGLKIYTTLSPSAQELAQTKVRSHINNLVSYFKNLKELKEKQNKQLQASLISVDVTSGEVIALVGGTRYNGSQFNRVLDAHRQVGSIMKPFVYLAALENLNPDGENYTPLTQFKDEPFTHEYDNQKWSPKNYGKKFYGSIPLFYALKNSINVTTAKLGLEVGLKNIIETVRRSGIESPLKPFPSITLGAFEIYPWEMAQAYTTIARMGEKTDLFFIHKIINKNNDTLYEHSPLKEQVFSKESTAELIGMLKQTIQSGTARRISTSGFTWPAAGKTGTTSDSKDAWFIGFTPDVLTLVWIGYDDNTKHGLTGASGAVPLWLSYMQDYLKFYPKNDFVWPEGTVKVNIPTNKVYELIKEPKEHEVEKDIELIFKSENIPNF